MMPAGISMPSSKSSLEGKVAVVTGSTQGLGEATLRLFRERGCKGLVITGRNEERGRRLANELSSSSCKAIFVKADLANLEECRNIMRITDETFGTLHILVNAAATTDRGSLWDTTPEDYDRIMNVNTRAPFFLMQDAARIMEREHVEGSIINISSTASYGSMPMIAAYGMSKGALNVATKNAAYSLMWSRIRVNALAIGWMDTPGEDDIQRRLHCGDNWKEQGEQNQPFGRLLKPDEVARCIAFCASEESGMMTGCVIDFDQSVWGAGNAPVPPRKEEWARANGMTFSFEHEPSSGSKSSSSSSRTPTPPKPNHTPSSKPSTASDSTIPSAFSSSIRAHSKSPGRYKSRSKSPGSYKWQQSTEKEPTVTTAASADMAPQPSKASERIPQSEPSGSMVRSRSDSPGRYKSRSKSPGRYKWKQSAEKEPATTTAAATTNMEPRSSKASERIPDDEPSKYAPNDGAKESTEEASETSPSKPSTPNDDNDAAYPDEERPNPKEFRLMGKMQRDGEVDRPDDYLPGTDPFADAQGKKEKAKKKFAGNSDSYGTSKVDDWIGSGKTQKRTWKVKGEHTVP